MTDSVTDRESPIAHDATHDGEIGVDAKVLLGDHARVESTTPGGFLRGERERQERQLQQIAEELHLSRQAIEAIEGNRFTEFGAPVFAKGHLRRYAALLNVPADEVLSRYDQLSDAARAHEPRPLSVRPNEPVRRVDIGREPSSLRIAPRPPKHGLSWLPLLLAAIAVIGGAATWWWLTQRPAVQGLSVQNSTEQASADHTLQGAIEQAEVSRIEATAAAAMDDHVAAKPVPPTDRPETRAETATPAEAPAVVEQRRVAANPPPGKVRLRLTFKQDSWAEVYDGRGNRMMYDVGRSDLPRVIDTDPPVQVVLGYAPAVDVEINGVAKVVPERRVNDSVARFVVQADGSIQ